MRLSTPPPMRYRKSSGNRVRRTLSAATAAVSQYVRKLGGAENKDFHYEATLSVWCRWFILAGCLIETSYRIDYGALSHILNTLYIAVMMAANGYVHHRLRFRHRVNVYGLFTLSAMDVAMISFSVSLSGGLDSRYFVLYYPAAAMVAWLFTSPYMGCSWATLVAAVYAGVCLVTGDGLDFRSHDDKVLFYRVLALFAVVGFVNILARFERLRRIEAVEQEVQLREERIALSRTIHDTVAQSVYVVGLGIETARDQASQTSSELTDRLDAAYILTRTALWELRHPIDSGQIFEGRHLEETLSSHAYSFTAITDLPAEVVQTGDEPDLHPLARGLLLGIAHNAMTNVLLHARASRVEVNLDYQADHLRLSVSDDGIGMPQESERRGHGLHNMAANAERLGGRLEVSPGPGGAGTTVTCVIPYHENPGGTRNVNESSDQSNAGRRQ